VTLTHPNNAALAAKPRPEPAPVATRRTAHPTVAAGITTRHHLPRTSPTRSRVGITRSFYVPLIEGSRPGAATSSPPAPALHRNPRPGTSPPTSLVTEGSD
jgi:hypothetical protein